MRQKRLVWMLALGALTAFPTMASASPDPYIFTPEAGSEETEVPPRGFLEGPCGLAVDDEGRFYVSDFGHNSIDVFTEKFQFYPAELQLNHVTSKAPNRACGLAIDPLGRLYVSGYHGTVLRFDSIAGDGRTELYSGFATGVAAEGAGGNVFVDEYTHISVYGPTGDPVEVGGAPLEIGEASLEKGFGVAVSGYPGTKGFLYVADAGSNTVKVYNPATDTENPVEEIAPGFTSLRDSALAVDDKTGELYVTEDLQPKVVDSAEAAIQVFESDGNHEARLKYNVFDARPSGLAVDNSGGKAQGRVYVTSGSAEHASVLAYEEGAAGSETLPAPPIQEAPPSAEGSEAPLPEPPPSVTCENDSCQQLPAEPTDPELTTLQEGSADPPVRYFNTNRLPHYATFHGHHHRAAHRKGKGGHLAAKRGRKASSQ